MSSEPPAPNPEPPLPPEYGPEPEPNLPEHSSAKSEVSELEQAALEKTLLKEKNRRWTSSRVLAVLAGTAVYTLWYALCAATGQWGGAALFLLMPFISAFIVGRLTPEHGQIIRTCFISLGCNGLITLVLFPEGICCMVMAMPIFGMMTLLGAVAARALYRPGSVPGQGCITPVAGLLLLCGYTAWDMYVLAQGAPVREARLEFLLNNNPEQVFAALSFQRAPRAELPGWLHPLLPKPDGYHFSKTGIGALRWVDYGSPQPGDDFDRPRGKLVWKITQWEPGHSLELECISDPTKFHDWIAFERVRVEFEPNATNGTRVRLAMRYRRKLGPDFYFEPITAAGVSAMLETLRSEIKSNAE